MTKLQVHAFFFGTLLVGAFIGGATVDLLDQQEQIEAIALPVAPNAPLFDAVEWAGDAGEGYTSASVYAEGPFYIDPEMGVRLVVKYLINPNGTIEHDIYAFPDKEEIYGTGTDGKHSGESAAGQRP